MDRVPFVELPRADLVVDRVYAGGEAKHQGDDPIFRLLPVGNAGGFRYKGSVVDGNVQLLALYTSLADAEWPDRLDLATGAFTYYGDNKRPGRELHATPRRGNLLLRDLFEHSLSPRGRAFVPPILLFSKAGNGRDVVFRGLLVPGHPSSDWDESLVAIWRSTRESRFQNYRAIFTVLNVRTITRAWIDDVVAGRLDTPNAPEAWLEWRRTGLPVALRAPRPLSFRTREEQLPHGSQGLAMLSAIHDHFADRPHDFEHCAAQIWLMLAPATEELEVTRASRDGGRDAVGRYRIGPPSDQIRVDFALEAKCYRITNSVGVRELSRLISRIRHRNFGVLVTTSYLHQQAYRELREDQHPVAVVAGRDIVEALKQHGIGSAVSVRTWLAAEFPPPNPRPDIVWPKGADDSIGAS